MSESAVDETKGERERMNRALATLLPHGEKRLGLEPGLPDFSVFIIEGGVASVVDKGPHTRLFVALGVFQNDVCELALFRTEDEHGQVS